MIKDRKGITVRYAHLRQPSTLKKGEIVKRGDRLGIVGNSGQSYGVHLHIDDVIGHNNHIWRVADYESGLVMPDVRQLREYFIDKELFGGNNFRISQYFFEPSYTAKLGKRHWGFDLVPSFDGIPWVYWNRSLDGEVIGNGNDPGYGNYLMIYIKGKL